MTAPYLNVPVFSWPAAPGGLLYTYAPGGVSAKTTYAEDGTTPNPNPVVLDVSGTAIVRGEGLYHFLLKDSTGATTLWDADYYSVVGFTAASVGAALYPTTLQEINASITPTSFAYPAGDVRRYGAIGDGSNDDSTAFHSATLCNGKVTVPPGTYLITNVTVATDDVAIEGHGKDSILKVGAANSNLFNVTAQNFKLRRCMWQGNGSSNSSINGSGVYLNGAGGAIFEDNYSTGFGFGAITGVAASALAGPKIYRQTCRLTGTGGNEFYLGGIWVNTVIEDADCYSTLADRALLLFDNSTTGWTGLRVTRGGARGYVKQQWATTDEHWDGSRRVWDVLFDGLYCVQSNWSAIKVKTSQNVKIINNSFEGCGIAQEDVGSGLFGDVLCNSLGSVNISNNTFLNSGSCAIRCNTALVSQYPASTPGGQAVSNWNISHNQIDTTGVAFASQGNGIILSDAMKNIIVDGNNMRNLSATGFSAVQTSVIPFMDMTYVNNTIQDSPNANPAISIAYGQSLRMHGNLCQNFGTTGVQLDNIDEINIGPTDTVLDAHVAAGFGYQVGNFRNLRLKARVGNSTYTAWAGTTSYTVGLRVNNGANVYECVVGGTSGGGAGPVATSGADTSDGSVTWYFIGKYQLLGYAVRIVGSGNGRADIDFDPTGCATGPIALLTPGTAGTRIHYITNLNTTDATVTSAKVIPIPDLTAWMVEMKVLAQAGAVPDRAQYHKTGLYYRNGGNVTLQSLTTISEVESNAAWLAEPKLSSTNLTPMQVTGAAATVVNWQGEITILGMP